MSEVKVKLGELEITENQTDMDIQLNEFIFGYSTILKINFYMPNFNTAQYLKEKQIIHLYFNDSSVFSGIIENVIENIKSPTIIYKIIAIDETSKKLKESKIIEDFKGLTIREIAENICNTVKIPYKIIDHKKLLQKKLSFCNFYDWRAIDCLEWLFDNLNYFWFISKKHFYAYDYPSKASPIINISKETGLLKINDIIENNPIADFKGYKVLLELNPLISVGTIINLESEKAKKGSFLVLAAKHKRIIKGHHTTELIITSTKKIENYQESKLLKYNQEFNITELIKKLIHEELNKYRSINFGTISEYYYSDSDPDHPQLSNDVFIGVDSKFEDVRPSIELIPKKLELLDVPIVSPFAHKTAGLVFPYYPKMKSILLSIGGKKDDHLLFGGIWDNEDNKKPKGIDWGDFRFDLPVYSDQNKEYQKKNSQILIDNKGNLSLNFKSLLLKIHENYLSINQPSVGNNGEVLIDVNGALIKANSNEVNIEVNNSKIKTTADQTEIDVSGTKFTMKSGEIKADVTGTIMKITPSGVEIN